MRGMGPNMIRNIMMMAARFLMRHMWLYYILNYTWGIIMTAIGWIIMFLCWLLLSLDVERYGPSHYVLSLIHI